MKCSCGKEDCGSEIVWDTGSHTLRAVNANEEILMYYDANSLVELIKEAKEALIELAGGDK